MSREFRELKTLAEAREILAHFLPRQIQQGHFGLREVPIAQAVGRVLHEPVVAPTDLPAFDRSTVDGYAVRAADTFGASESLPAYLRVVGEVRMGQVADLSLGDQECARVPTGGMLPRGADAVVMVEHTQMWSTAPPAVEVLRPVAPGQNVVRRGDDVRAGAPLLPAGHRLRPQDVSALAGLGIASVPVRWPRVAILSTGNELVPHEADAPPGRIRDMNRPALAAAVTMLGGEPLDLGLVPDEPEAVRERLVRGVESADLVLVSGGTSVGQEDLIPELLDSLGPPGVVLHGLAMRPGKPVVIAVAGETPIFGLPGHPASALIIFRELVAPLLRQATGAPPPGPPLAARLTRNVPSQIGREDLVGVALAQVEGEWRATPLLAPAALISSLVRADGLVRIPAGVEGLHAGEVVEVEPL